MAVTDQQKIDFLLKKIGFTKTKTGNVSGTGDPGEGSVKQPFAEAIPSPLVVPNSSLWNEADSIPATPPGSDTTQVKVYSASSAVRLTEDITVSTASQARSWIAYSTYNNTSSARLTNWIDTQFGAGYLIKVYNGDPNSGGTPLSAGATNENWFFDYSAGVLNFNDDTCPVSPSDSIYIVGYRYIGQTGAPTSGISTFSFKDLTVERNLDVGVQGGISTFRNNIDANGIIEGIAGENKIPSLYADLAALPSASTYHGMFAHVHATGRGYFAHAGNWLELVNKDTSGNVGLSGDLDVDGHTNLDNVSIAGVTTTGGLLDINAGGQANTFKVEDLTSGRVVLAGTGGELEDSANLTFNGSNLTVGGNVNAVDGVFSGNVSIGGTLTYEDVTNVDSVGLLTARSGIRVTGGVIEALAGENKIPSLYANMAALPSAGTYHGMFAHVHSTGRGYFAHAGNWMELVNKELNGVVGTGTERYNIGPVDLTTLDVSGISTFAGNVDINADIDVDGHTNLDNVSVAGVGTFASSIHVADSIIHEGDPNTQINFTNDIFEFRNNNVRRLWIQNGNNFLYGSNHFEATTSESKAGQYIARFRDTTGDDTVVHFHNTNVKNTVFRWNDYGSSSSAGNFVFTNLTGTEYARFTGSGNFNLLRDLDVDGHTNLDNVSISGFTTITQDLDVDGHTNLDNVSIAGVTTITQDLDVDGHTELDNVNIVGVTTHQGHVLPSADSAYDLGSSSKYWRHVYADNVTGGGGGVVIGDDIITRNLQVNGISTHIGISTFNSATFHDDVTFDTANGNDILFDKSDNSLKFGDSVRAKFGASTDMEIYHTTAGGGTNFVKGTGNLTLQSNVIVLEDQSGNDTIRIDAAGGAVKIYHPGSGEKLRTTSSGVQVTGLTDTDTFLSSGNATFSGTITAGGATGTSGQYLKSTGSGVAWASFPSARTSQVFTASSGDTTFSFNYTVGLVDVFVNGIKLSTSEFTATNGSSVVLAVGCFVGDIVEILSYNVATGGGGGGTLSNIVEDTTPQLGGNLDLFNKTINGTGNINITGVATATKFVGDGSGLTGVIASGTGIIIKNSGSTVGTAGTINFGDNLSVSALSGGAVTVSASAASTAEVRANTLTVSGISTFTGNIDANGDLDVDGHTNLDNVSVAGVTTFSDNIHVQSSDDTLALFESTDALAQIQFKDNSSNANLPTIGIQANSFYFNNMGSTSLRIAPGKVGVNEVTPLADFHVNQNEAHSSTYYLDSDAGVLIENINAAASRKSVLKLIGDSAIVYGGSGNGTLIFAQRQKETASFDANGNFSVNYDLDVDGHTNLDNVSIAGVVTATTFNGALQATSGTFSSNVDITGDLDVDGHTNLDNVSVAGVVTATSFVGDGSSLTGISGGVTSDAQRNTVGGSGAGDSFSGTSANSNTLFGKNAGTNINTGDQNVMIGDSAGHDTNTEIDNVLIGFNAGYKNGASNNVCVGSEAGTQNSSGNRVTYVGKGAGQYMNGNDNTAIGYNSLNPGNPAQTGQRNTALGSLSGRATTTGIENIYIGYNAGNNAHATGNNCIIIGNDAAATSSSVSNEVTIGDDNITHFRVPGIGVSFSEGGAVVSGVVTATSFVGDGSALTGISGSGGVTVQDEGSTLSTQATTINFVGSGVVATGSGATKTVTISGGGSATTINNNADNRLITGSGTANTLEGESNLLFDGTDLTNSAGDIAAANGSQSSPSFRNYTDTNTGMFFPSADKLAFATGGFSRVVIDDNDGMIIGNGQVRSTKVGNRLTVGGSTHAGITIKSGTSSAGSLYFSDGTSGDDEQRGLVQYDHSSNFLRFYTNAGERFRIASSGQIGLSGANYGTSGQVLTSQGSGSAATWTNISSSPDVGITTNLSGTFTASAGTPATINTFGYSSNDRVVEYTILIEQGASFQSQKVLAMRSGSTVHSTQFAVMFSSSLLVQCDVTISGSNMLLRATPETGVSGSTTYKIKREVM